MLSTLAIGLATGVGQWPLAIVGTVFLLVLLEVIESFEPAATRELVIAVKAADPMVIKPRLERLLRRQAARFEIKAMSPEELQYDVQWPVDRPTDGLSERIAGMDPKDSVDVSIEQSRPSRHRHMKLIVQPDHGVEPVLAAIARARISVEIVIFRLDVKDVTIALETAVDARRRRAGADRAHQQGRREAAAQAGDAAAGGRRDGVALGRGLAPLSRQDAADRWPAAPCQRLQFHLARHRSQPQLRGRHDRATPGEGSAAPVPGRLRPAAVRAGLRQAGGQSRDIAQQLGDFLAGARRQLCIYDPEISDPRMVRVLADRLQAGVDVRIIGKATPRLGVAGPPLPGASPARARDHP